MSSSTLDTIGSAIGFAGDAIGLITGLVDTIFPEPPPESMNKIRVHVGLVRGMDSAEDKSLGGNAPALAAWDAAGNFLDQVTPDGPTAQLISSPGFRDYSIEGRGGADYLSVVQTGNDGICIHLITAKSANLGLEYIWTGDVGKACGAPWYPQRNPISNAQFQTPPVCVWIDGNADSGHIWQGFNMHLGSFRKITGHDDESKSGSGNVADVWNANRDLMCKSEPRFSMYEDIQIGNQIRTYHEDPTFEEPASEAYSNKVLNADNWKWSEKPPSGKLPLNKNGKGVQFACAKENCPPEGPSYDKNLAQQPESRRRSQTRRRSQSQAIDSSGVVSKIKKRQELHADRLIISEIEGHSAIEVCNSQSSLGPDFLSWHEMMFCDMSEKQLWPVCVDDAGSYCFDMDTQTVRGSVVPLTTTDQPLFTNSSALTTHMAVPNKLYTFVRTWGGLV